MVAISFSVLKEKLLDGSKCQTIRPYSAKRMEQINRIRTLQIFWKQRNSKECEKLFNAELTEDISIVYFDSPNPGLRDENGKIILYDKIGEIAKRDGFERFYDMWDWFRNYYGYDFLSKNKFMVIRFKKVVV